MGSHVWRYHVNASHVLPTTNPDSTRVFGNVRRSKPLFALQSHGFSRSFVMESEGLLDLFEGLARNA
ncbi:hypothetical protein VNO77_20175 [Canavalia gladiata]|uniref:Uncharacterized protein n=1 Tax=Canavalia gladiata TaxID=3824 RepID=A0AAN9LSB5_CANGL